MSGGLSTCWGCSVHSRRDRDGVWLASEGSERDDDGARYQDCCDAPASAYTTGGIGGYQHVRTLKCNTRRHR